MHGEMSCYEYCACVCGRVLMWHVRGAVRDAIWE